MKNLLNNLALCVLILCSLNSCNSDEELQVIQDPLNIMIIADHTSSISESPYSSTYALWQNFILDEKSVQLIGENQPSRTEYPPLNENNYWNNYFYSLHFNRLPYGLKDYTTSPFSKTPDVLLIAGALNGVLSATEADDFRSNLIEIIDLVRVQNPEVKIYIERFAPWRTDRVTESIMKRTEEYYNIIEATITEENTAISPIVLIDMETDWKNEYWDNTQKGYNAAGMVEAAQRTYSAITK